MSFASHESPYPPACRIILRRGKAVGKTAVLAGFLLLSFAFTHLHTECFSEVAADGHQLSCEEREMSCSGGATCHTGSIHLSFLSDTTVVSLSFCQSFPLHKPTAVTRPSITATGQCGRAGEEEWTTRAKPAAPAGKGGCKSCS